MVERSLSMREVRGSIPRTSIIFSRLLGGCFTCRCSRHVFVYVFRLIFTKFDEAHFQTIGYRCSDGRFSPFARGVTILNGRSFSSSETEVRNGMKS